MQCERDTFYISNIWAFLRFWKLFHRMTLQLVHLHWNEFNMKWIKGEHRTLHFELEAKLQTQKPVLNKSFLFLNVNRTVCAIANWIGVYYVLVWIMQSLDSLFWSCVVNAESQPNHSSEIIITLQSWTVFERQKYELGVTGKTNAVCMCIHVYFRARALLIKIVLVLKAWTFTYPLRKHNYFIHNT